MTSTFPTFKQFLLEGGAATAEHNTVRATKADIEAALDFVSKHTGIAKQKLIDNLLGSTGHTLAGKKKDSGDIDIALEDGMLDRKEIVEKLRQATGIDKVPGAANTFSFPVPTSGGRKVQVDLMFVPSEKWARFGYHASADSQHKGVVRNMLLIAVLQNMFEPGKDLSVKDDEGKEVIRVRRGFKMDSGIERLFRVAPMRKDGKGRVALRAGTPDEVAAVLKQLGRNDKFSKEVETILDPDKAAALMFGEGVKAKDILSTEQVIKQIKKLPNHADIFKSAVQNIENVEQPIPDEIKQYA